MKYDRLGLNVGSLPFAPADTTAGSESEMQTVVVGNKNNVDLPLFIEQSNYFANTKRRAKAGDTSRKVMTDLEKYLNMNTGGDLGKQLGSFPAEKMGSAGQSGFFSMICWRIKRIRLPVSGRIWRDLFFNKMVLNLFGFRSVIS